MRGPKKGSHIMSSAPWTEKLARPVRITHQDKKNKKTKRVT